MSGMGQTSKAPVQAINRMKYYTYLTIIQFAIGYYTYLTPYWCMTGLDDIKAKQGINLFPYRSLHINAVMSRW
jgi:hypothetical protein